MGKVHKAAESGDFSKVKKLLNGNWYKRKIDINDKDEHGYTPLMWAVLSDKMNIIELLIMSNADVNEFSKIEMTSMHLAAINGSLEVTKLLIDNGAEINVGDIYNVTPLHKAAQYGHSKVCALLIENGAYINIDSKSSGPSFAGLSNVMDLSSSDPEIIKHTHYGGTPLHTAAAHGNTDIVKLLIDEGADINDYCKFSPLHHASRNGHFDVSKFLIERGCNVDSGLSEGITPVRWAAAHGKKDIVQLLIESGAKLQDYGHEATPLHSAARNGHGDIVELLIDHGISVDVATTSGETPLHSAVSGNQTTIVKLLLDKSANVNAVYAFKTPLDEAMVFRSTREEIINLLKEHGGKSEMNYE